MARCGQSRFAVIAQVHDRHDIDGTPSTRLHEKQDTEFYAAARAGSISRDQCPKKQISQTSLEAGIGLPVEVVEIVEMIFRTFFR